MTTNSENPMKLSKLHTSLLLAVAVTLTACGGKATFDVGGQIEGLAYSGLELTNVKNGEKLAVAAGATTFKMAQTIEYGTEYDVRPTKQPLHQTCAIGNGADTAGRLAAINIGVKCVTNESAIGGKVTGLTAAGLVLVNGSPPLGDQVNVGKDATTYAFPKPVKFDDTYSVVVLTQPTGLKCTVANGVGKMGDVAVSNVDVTCAPAPIGG